MSNFEQDAEQFASKEFSGGQGQQSGDNVGGGQDKGQGGYDQQSGGGQGQGQGGYDQQSGGGQQQQQTSGGGGGMEDQMINKEVDQFATQEGLPSGMDNTINKGLDAEVNKFV